MRILLCSVWMYFGCWVGLSYGQDQALDKLAQAKSPFEAATLEEDVWAFWMESDSAVTDVLMERAFRAEATQQAEIAILLYDRVIRLNPDYAEVWHRRALLHLKNERFDEAILDLENALTLEPRHFAAWSQLGSVFIQLSAMDEALLAFEKALAVHPYFEFAKRGHKYALKKANGTAV